MSKRERTNISLDIGIKRIGEQRARIESLSLSRYIERLILKDVQKMEPSQEKGQAPNTR